MSDNPTQKNFWLEPVKNLPLLEPIKVSDKSSVGESIQLMQEHKISCVLVMNANDQLVGMYTEKDVINTYVGTNLQPETEIRAVMTRPAKFVFESATFEEAMFTFGENQIRNLPICTPDKKVIGVLTTRVLLNYLSENFPNKLLNLPPEESQVMKEVAGG